MAYLTRKFGLLHYMPLTLIACFILMIAGMSIWVHFTITAVDYIRYALELLGPSVSSDGLDTVLSTVVSLPIVYMIFGCIIFAMLVWRVWAEAEADITGQFHPWQFYYWAASIVCQIAWWAIMVVVVADVMIDSALSAVIRVIYDAIIHTVYDILPRTGLVINPVVGVCYPQCIDLTSYSFIHVNTDQSCVCNVVTLVNTAAALESALSAVTGALVGIWLMFVAGGILQMYISYGFGRLEAQEDFEERLTKSGGGGGGGSGGEKRYSRM